MSAKREPNDIPKLVIDMDMNVTLCQSYITYVSELPTGREAGQFLALDLGGTNFRVILARLERGDTSVRLTSARHAVSQEIMQGDGQVVKEL